MTENWWSILHESPRIERFRGGRAHAATERHRAWIARHNFLAARGGFALPDLSVYRDGDRVAVLSVPDPRQPGNDYPIEFVAEGRFRLDPEGVEDGLGRFVDGVAERIRDKGEGSGAEAAEFLANWDAIRQATGAERRLCELTARMGLDPYDPSELPDELSDLIDTNLGSFPPPLQEDLADVALAPKLQHDLEWIARSIAALHLDQGTSSGGGFVGRGLIGIDDAPAHRFGYRAAAGLREAEAVPEEIDDLEKLLFDRLDWDPGLAHLAPTNGVANRLKALVGRTSGRIRVATPDDALSPVERRFLLARALFFSRETTGIRLVTSAYSWSQQASRAFAAEFLAPASRLSAVAGPQVTFEQVEELAQKFRVSAMVIRHQLVNHRIAEFIDL